MTTLNTAKPSSPRLPQSVLRAEPGQQKIKPATRAKAASAEKPAARPAKTMAKAMPKTVAAPARRRRKATAAKTTATKQTARRGKK
jgi:hypothetical protein